MRNIAGTSLGGGRECAHGTGETLLWFNLQVQDDTVQVQEMLVQRGGAATRSRFFASLRMTAIPKCHPEQSEGSAFLFAAREKVGC